MAISEFYDESDFTGNLEIRCGEMQLMLCFVSIYLNTRNQDAFKSVRKKNIFKEHDYIE